MKVILRRVGGLSALEATILSALARCPDPRGMSPTDIAVQLDLPRPTIYAVLARFHKARLVSRRPDPTPEASQRVLYCILGKGLKARERFAFAVGVWPP